MDLHFAFSMTYTLFVSSWPYFCKNNVILSWILVLRLFLEWILHFVVFIFKFLYASSKALLVASQLNLSGLHGVLVKTDLV